MSYSALLTCHLVAVALFLAGLFTAAGLLPGLADPDRWSAAQRQEVARLIRMGRFVTTPALLLVWGFGIAMAVDAGWYVQGWLAAKVVLVLMLSGWHGRQSLILRRLAAGRAAPRARPRALLLLAAVVLAIIALVVVKPF